jgi:integrase
MRTSLQRLHPIDSSVGAYAVTKMDKNVIGAADGHHGACAGGDLDFSLLPVEASPAPPEVLSEAEAVALLRACSPRASTGIRNRTLIAVLWRSGLRISEALALEVRDVDPAGRDPAGAPRQGG